jgi:predicted nucleic acid-binding protein
VAVLRRSLLTGKMTAVRAAAALEDYLDLPLNRHGHRLLLARSLALRENFSAYDATYVALAERLNGVLVTADTPLAKAVRTHLELAVVEIS